MLKLGIWAGASTTLAGINIAYSRRYGQKKHDLDPQIIKDLSLQANVLTPYIRFKGFEHAKELGAPGYNNITPKPNGFAHMLLTMSYFEEGQEGVDKTIKAVTDRGWEIVLGDPVLPEVAAGQVINPTFTPKEPYRMTILPQFLWYQKVFIHETYHINQFIRDGNKSILITLPYMIGIYSIIYSLFSSITDRIPLLNRRKVLSNIIKTGLSFACQVGSAPYISPYEAQALTQTNGNLPHTLASSPYFKFTSFDLFEFR